MTPEHEAESLKLKLLDEKQSYKESIEDFAFRLTEISTRAYESVEEPSRKSACYSTFLKGLTNKDIRIRLREDRNVKNFDSAVEEAARLHDIRESENQTPEPVITEPVDLWKVEEYKSQTNHPRLGERSHSPANSRARFSGESRYEDKIPQPGHLSFRDRNRIPANTSVRFSSSGERRKEGYSNEKRRNRSPRPVITCHECQGPNHIARNCRANF